MTLLSRIAVVLAAITFVPIAQADPLTFRVEDVVFDDGGTLTGTFSFDPQDTSFFAVNLTSSYGSTDFPGTTHIGRVSTVYSGVAGESALAEFRVRDASGTFDLFLRFASPLYSGNLQSAIFVDPLDSFELAVSAPTYQTRNVVNGRVTVNIFTVPPDLNPGDQYRLVFITREKIFFATSSNIADYDNWVTSQANMSPELAALSTNWRVIGSTSSVDAKIHTGTDDSPAGPNGVPIYRLDGILLAQNYDDLWDGSIQNPLYVAQDGSVLDTCCGTWTGTRTDGTGIPGDELGATDLFVVDGAPYATAGNWVQTGAFGATNPQYLYAISDVLTVTDATIEVAIDIKPGNDANCSGALPVAVLGSDTFDVTQIDPTTLSFEGLDVRVRGNGALSCGVEDVNLDGFADFICQYQDATTDGTLTGELLDGTPIEGVDLFCVAH